MCGQPKAHPHHKTPTEHIYYVCQFNADTPRHVAAAPDHPRTVQVREDFLKAETFSGLSAYALGPGREHRLAQLIPHTATAGSSSTTGRPGSVNLTLKLQSRRPRPTAHGSHRTHCRTKPCMDQGGALACDEDWYRILSVA